VTRIALALVVLATWVLEAGATPPDLRVRAAPAPAPRTLAMRADADADADAADGDGAASTPAPAPDARIARQRDERFAAFPSDLGELEERVVFRFQLGYQIDEGQGTGRALASGEPVPTSVRNTRFFQVGDLVAGTRGLLVTPLSTYLAASFKLDQDGGLASATSPSIYDTTDIAGGVLVRSAWAEASDLGGWLSPLRVRGGRQFRYGLAVIHYDGLSAAWEGRALSASFFAGRRVSLWRSGTTAGGVSPNPAAFAADAPPAYEGPVAGFAVQLRLERITRAPLVLDLDTLTWEGAAAVQSALRYELSRDATLSLYLRNLDGRLARWGLGLRARTSRVTTLSLDLDHRLGRDWAYDFVVRSRGDDPAAEDARYLYLGHPTPELRLAGRAGTVLLDNVDVALWLAGALPVGGGEPNAHEPAYVELGAAVDGRFAYNLQVAVLGRWRRYDRADAPTVDDLAVSADPFGDVAAVGDRQRVDGGLRVRYSLGRKRFATELEMSGGYGQYVRFTDVAGRLVTEETDDATFGVRLRFEAWIGTRFRVLADYEVNSAHPEMPELIGLQRLRILGEASF
jgi:hypothetical protein